MARSLNLFKVFIILTSVSEFGFDLVVEHCASVAHPASQLPAHLVQSLEQKIAVFEVQGLVD